MIVVILAGGSGTRLWPLSNNALPKQFLKIEDNTSLIRQTALRFSTSRYVKKILVVTNQKHRSLVEKELKDIKNKQILLEPHRKNTAPAIALAMQYLKEEERVALNTKILITPSDQLISPEKKFHKYLAKLSHIDFKNNIILFGIRPTAPEIGYGYIKVNSQERVSHLYRAEKFIEKPSFSRAKEFFLHDEYFWNAGFFMFTMDTFFKKIKKYCRDIQRLITSTYQHTYDHFDLMPSISFDYAVMEKSKNIMVFPLEVSWSDIGSWDSIYDVLEKDADENVKKGNVITLNTKNSLIMSQKKLISTVGLKNMIIVETEDGIFIGKKGQSQKLKKLIEKIKEKNSCEKKL